MSTLDYSLDMKNPIRFMLSLLRHLGGLAILACLRTNG